VLHAYLSRVNLQQLVDKQLQAKSDMSPMSISKRAGKSVPVAA
jgi:hypothetical protein